ncbi:hypothetical protein JG687_00006168 [Phytophthora cactorum]|uniref:Uncharacterized protein n=1 Tax=Phytophthora cactorum TaxID=29920 RepID=A0A8T1UJ32_9STRA|nr:hypothetical protein GQ600_10407 [Phytophthora cactorum]KAG6964111.1 hypothetical protein JG687_00006168 [Phytophthora cactorum]
MVMTLSEDTKYDTIVEQRVPMSIPTSIPSETLRKSFKPISSRHRTKTNDCLSKTAYSNALWMRTTTL